MAIYKVPQDVEAEDKLIGPFTMRQFIFILLFFGACWMGFLLARVSLPLVVIMLPFIVLFGILGFVQRKDQPVEVYMAAVVRFYLKSHRRIWNQEGYDQHIMITAPKKVEIKRYRDITQTEVQSQLNQLAGILDSRGWVAKGIVMPPSDRLVTIRPVDTADDGQLVDVMDEANNVSQKFNQLLQKQTADTKHEAIERMHNPAAIAATVSTAASAPAPKSVPAPAPVANQSTQYNPYPQMHQTTISPKPATTATTQPAPAATTPVQNQTMPAAVAPDIIRLANNNDLTVSAIAREAHTLPTEEVVISLH